MQSGGEQGCRAPSKDVCQDPQRAVSRAALSWQAVQVMEAGELSTVMLTKNMSSGKQQWVDWHQKFLADLPTRVKARPLPSPHDDVRHVQACAGRPTAACARLAGALPWCCCSTGDPDGAARCP